MHNILVPFDNSAAARNALRYAAQMARFFAARLYVFHSYHIPAYTGQEFNMVLPDVDLKEENKEALEKVKAEIRKEFGEIDIHKIVVDGLLQDVLEETCEKYHIDLIVSGIGNTHSLIKEYVLGSNTVDVARGSRFPVLVVPESCHFHKIQNVALACDYKDGKGNTIDIQSKYYSLLFGAKLNIVNVLRPDEELSEIKSHSIREMEAKMKNTHHQTIFVNNSNVADGLIEVVNDRNIDMIMIHPRRYNLFSNLFHRSVTRQVVFHSPVPVLCFHDIND
jgi:nucleotide-binding universal stress UspA family protein